MGFGELLLLAVGLSMDAFAVSICKGLSVKKGQPKGNGHLRRLVWRIPGLDAADRIFPGRPVLQRYLCF